jgi:hypothetical protein
VLLHSSGSYTVVVCIFIAVEMCLLSSCLAVDISDFTVPSVGCHVAVQMYVMDFLIVKMNCSSDLNETRVCCVERAEVCMQQNVFDSDDRRCKFVTVSYVWRNNLLFIEF